MSRAPRDDASATGPPRGGGLANVFRGLASSRSTRTVPIAVSPTSSLVVPTAELSIASRGLSPLHMEALELLEHGSANERVEAAQSLRLVISEYPLNPVLDIWSAAKDMIEPSQAHDIRRAGWEILGECARHGSATDLERKEYFDTLSASAHPDDFHLQITAISQLTQGGRTLSGFEYDLLPVLTEWLEATYEKVVPARRAASQRSRSTTRDHSSSRHEIEDDYQLLFSFLTDVIKFSFNNASESAVCRLLDVLLEICKRTSVSGDIRLSILLIDTIVTFGEIPAPRLEVCVLVLSSIYCIVEPVRQAAWRTLSHLCKSHYGQSIVRLLLNLLKNATSDDLKSTDRAREIKGALAVMQQLLSKSTEGGYPPLSYAYLMESFSNVAHATSSGKTQAYVLDTIASLFGSSEAPINNLILDEDWSLALDVANSCCTGLLPASDSNGRIRSPVHEDIARNATWGPFRRLLQRLERLLTGDFVEYIPREDIAAFLLKIHPLLPDSSISTLLDYLQEFRCCAPSDPRWEQNVSIVMDGFFRNKQKKTETRLCALKTVIDSYEVGDLTEEAFEQDLMKRLVKELFEDVTAEADVAVLEAMMDLMVSVAPSCEYEIFCGIIDTIKSVVRNGHEKPPLTPASPVTPEEPRDETSADLSLSGVAAKATVKMFLRTMNHDSQKAVMLHELLVKIASNKNCEHDARLTAMKLLFRVRCDWTYHVFVTDDLDTTHLAEVLGRTDEATGKKRSEESTLHTRASRGDHAPANRSSRGVSFSSSPAPDRGIPTRSSTGPKSAPPARHPRAWCLPDPDALPEVPARQISPVLLSRLPKPSVSSEAKSEAKYDKTEKAPSETESEIVAEDVLEQKPLGVLDFAAWFDAVLSMLSGSDWEIYSFVLVHLPSQLSNHTIFSQSIHHIRSLRKLLCEQIRSNGFQEPPAASGLWRADVAICLFHSLNIMISYHELFQKGEEDEMVRTFGLGITTWERTARPCIHALTVCCHEMPLSVGKSVVQMLSQMSTIITQSTVAMHILEFLASLSRLQNVYVNFREDEYKIVFAICFRYIEHIKDKRRSNRSSQVSEPSTPAAKAAMDSSPLAAASASASDDLPEYVYALAYHVLIFWYLALKLPDRANYVGWIAKRLFADADGTGQASDDYAITTMDLMQRVAYADVDESVEDGNFTESRFGEILKRRWVVGNSIVTVKQATSSGWAQIVKRQPSGVSAYLIRETFRPPPPHQVQSYVDVSREGQANTNNILPSHLLVQLMSPSPQHAEASRPIPLPSDDATDRSLRVLDRLSSLDGHKVGIIYIGEGQTEEIEILANVSGSSDYVTFLNGLGSLTKLKGANFNPQGLDREYNTDGEYTICWRDRVTEMVFHVTTQMPTNLERDPQVAQKKKHIGNDFVNIIFNDSGLPFKFDTFPSQFNYINIVISPASRASFIASREPPAAPGEAKPTQETFYRVQVMSKPGFPHISPAAETKMVSLRALPVLIRLIALNASVFCHVWQSRLGGEHVSSWRSRLNEIRRLRDKHASKSTTNASSSASPPPTAMGSGLAPQQWQPQQQAEPPRSTTSVRDSLTSLRRTSMATLFSSEPASHRSSVMSSSAAAGETEVGTTTLESVIDSVDFSKWA